MAGQTGGATLQSTVQTSNPFLPLGIGYATPPPPSCCLLNTGLAGLGPHLPFTAPQSFTGLPRDPLGFASPTFPTFPQSVVANPAPLSTGLEQIRLGTDCDPSQVDDDKQDMDAPYPALPNTFSDPKVSQPRHTPTPLAFSDLQSYVHILSIVLAVLVKSEFLVRDTPGP